MAVVATVLALAQVARSRRTELVRAGRLAEDILEAAEQPGLAVACTGWSPAGR